MDEKEISYFYPDDVALIGDMIKENWGLGPDYVPNVRYDMESQITDARTGLIYIYQMTRNNTIASTDYGAMDRQSSLSIRISNRFREDNYNYAREVYRILLENRRAPILKKNGYEYLTPSGDHVMNDASGWYVTTIDVHLTGYAIGVPSSGFGSQN